MQPSKADAPLQHGGVPMADHRICWLATCVD